MDLSQFKASLADDVPPADADLALQALWYDANGDWDKAHSASQAQDDRDGAWVHAYLHRVEGDLPNAGYWYRRAGRPASTVPLADEWEEIAVALCTG